jgi:conjugal transfer pilus assembly protein TraV
MALATCVLASCSSMSGLGSRSSYACQAPEGVSCESVSGVYANAVANNLPVRHGKNAKRPADAPQARIAPPPAEPPGLSLRSPAHYLRLWMKPWVDIDGDLYDHAYIYVQINEGRWQVDHIARPPESRHTLLRTPVDIGNPSPGATNATQPRATMPPKPTPFNGAAPNGGRP